MLQVVPVSRAPMIIMYSRLDPAALTGATVCLAELTRNGPSYIKHVLQAQSIVWFEYLRQTASNLRMYLVNQRWCQPLRQLRGTQPPRYVQLHQDFVNNTKFLQFLKDRYVAGYVSWNEISARISYLLKARLWIDRYKRTASYPQKARVVYSDGETEYHFWIWT